MMVFLLEGLKRMRALISADVDEGELGTDGTAVVAGNTDLGVGVASTELTLETKQVTQDPPQFMKTYTLPNTGANNLYKEFGLRNTADDVLYIREIYTSFLKDQIEEVPVVALFTLRDLT